jgi:hypothetical protein
MSLVKNSRKEKRKEKSVKQTEKKKTMVSQYNKGMPCLYKGI